MKNDDSKILDSSEKIRILNEIAFNAGKARISPQTKYLHHCYYPGEGESHQTIPLYENFLFIYTLLKSKTGENVTEAKKLLEGLLRFQNNQVEKSKGNYPIYLHEYPDCKDRNIGIHLLPVFALIYKGFHQILGEALKKEFVIGTENLLHYCWEIPPENLSYSVKLTLAAGTLSLADSLQSEEFRQKGEALLQKPDPEKIHPEWFYPDQQGKIFTALHLIYSDISRSPWKKFWEFLQIMYDQNTTAYIGPAHKVYQIEGEPEVNLIDFHIAGLTGVFSKRLYSDRASNVEASLVQPHPEILALQNASSKHSGSDEGVEWSVIRNNILSWSCSDIPIDRNHTHWKSISPFRMCWGDLTKVRTCVAQGGNCTSIRATENKEEIIVEFTLLEEFNVEDKDLCKEIILSFDHGNDISAAVEGVKANTFYPGNEIIFSSGNIKFSLNFFIIEGEGEFFGHIMPGNRISELALKNENRFNAYDMQIFLRTLRRSSLCRIGLRINMI